jgi:undecaprenyl-diphosphatase
MQLLIAVLLAVIQGLTEFIPISSSGHLAVTQLLLGFEEPPVAFDVVLHLGTLIAVLIYYRTDVLEMIRSLGRLSSIVRPSWNTENPQKLLLLLIIATIPTAVIGLLLKHQVESAFSSLNHIAWEFVIGGAMMIATLFLKKCDRGLAEMKVTDALFIGVLQGASLFPAISRSGSTITAALFLGLTPQLAARFSFLLSIPAILGAVIFEIPDIEKAIGSTHELFVYLLSGAIAGVIGYLTIRPLIRIITHSKFYWFGIYCVVAGIILLAYIWVKTT